MGENDDVQVMRRIHLRGVTARDQIQALCFGVGAAPPGETVVGFGRDPQLQVAGNRARHVLLDAKHISGFDVVIARPEMVAAVCVDELNGDTHTVS